MADNKTAAEIAISYQIAYMPHYVRAGNEPFDALIELIEEAEHRGEARARQWQPIETAPRDGTQVLFVDEDDLYATASYGLSDDCAKGSWFIDGECWGNTQGYSHWMPLPAPPDKAIEQGDRK